MLLNTISSKVSKHHYKLGYLSHFDSVIQI